jgi:GGDEF domain-containing protein
VTDAWQKMLNDELTEEEGANLIKETVSELDNVLQDSLTARDTAIRIIGDQLAAPLRNTSWDNLIASLGAFLHPGPAYMLSWVAYSDWELRLDRVLASASARVALFIREIIGIFGQDIQRAFDLRTQSPDDWRGLTINVSENVIGGNYTVSIEIQKLSGDITTIEGPPDSILNLTRFLIQALATVNDSAQFTADRIDSFREQVRELDALLPKPQPTETAEAATPETATNEMAGTDTLDVVATSDDHS